MGAAQRAWAGSGAADEGWQLVAPPGRHRRRSTGLVGTHDMPPLPAAATLPLSGCDCRSACYCRAPTLAGPWSKPTLERLWFVVNERPPLQVGFCRAAPVLPRGGADEQDTRGDETRGGRWPRTLHGDSAWRQRSCWRSRHRMCTATSHPCACASPAPWLCWRTTRRKLPLLRCW